MANVGLSRLAIHRRSNASPTKTSVANIKPSIKFSSRLVGAKVCDVNVRKTSTLTIPYVFVKCNIRDAKSESDFSYIIYE